MDAQRTEDLLLALIGAFVWVASSDAGVSMIEFNKFNHAIVQSPFATQFEENQIRRYFKDTTTLFDTHYEKAVSLTTARLISLRDQGPQCEEVVRMSRAAVVADANVAIQEERVLMSSSTISDRHDADQSH